MFFLELCLFRGSIDVTNWLASLCLFWKFTVHVFLLPIEFHITLSACETVHVIKEVKSSWEQWDTLLDCLMSICFLALLLSLLLVAWYWFRKHPFYQAVLCGLSGVVSISSWVSSGSISLNTNPFPFFLFCCCYIHNPCFMITDWSMSCEVT